MQIYTMISAAHTYNLLKAMIQQLIKEVTKRNDLLQTQKNSLRFEDYFFVKWLCQYLVSITALEAFAFDFLFLTFALH